jgi:hypothetical protein
MIGHLFMTWEASVGVESEVAHLRRGDPNALSALLMRYQPFGSSKPQLDLALPFRRRVICTTRKSSCLYCGSLRY